VLLSSATDRVALVNQKLLDGAAPKASRDLHGGAWSFEAVDASGAVVYRDNVMNPHFVRGEFAPEGGGDTPDHVQALRPEPAALSVRVPLEAVSLRFYVQPLSHRGGAAPFSIVELSGEETP
jgi:hypothetical protein